MMRGMTKRKLLFVDDHTLVRQGLRALIEKHGQYEVVGEAENGRDALEKTAQLKPDMVLMDLFMPDMNGAEATRRIKEQHKDVHVLVLTMQNDAELLRSLMEYGASGYLLKENASSDLLTAIETVFSGKKYVSESFSENVLETLEEKRKKRRGTVELLTPREKEILQLIAEGKANKEIAVHLKISFKTVDTHRMHVMEKLDIHNTADLVRYALRAGIAKP